MARSVDVTPRKRPRQQRAREMERAILGAAERVLVEDGAAAFNTNRVAEVAGVSVGSLYQYFPNKAAILFRLHVQENATTFAAVAALLNDEARAPVDRLRAATRAFFETEAAEAPMRDALELAEVFYRDSPEYNSIHENAARLVRGFLESAGLPEIDGDRDLEHEAVFVYTVVTSVAEAATQRCASRAEALRWADECADMLIKHLGLAPAA